MAKFRVTGPDGSNYDVVAPEGATDAEVMEYVQSQVVEPANDDTPTEPSFMDELSSPDPKADYGALLPLIKKPGGENDWWHPAVWMQDMYKTVTDPAKIIKGEIPAFDESGNISPQLQASGRNAALTLSGTGIAVTGLPQLVPGPVGAALRELGPKAGDLTMNALPRGVKAVSRGVTSVAQPIIDRFDPEGATGRILAKRLMQQNPGMTLPEAINAAELQVRNLGDDAVLADTGDSARDLARLTIQTPGETKQRAKIALGTRAATEGTRAVKSVEENISPELFYNEKDAVKASKKLAGPKYEESYAANPNVADDELRLLLEQEPLVKAGMKKGLEIERINASEEFKPFQPETYGVAVDFDADGNAIVKDVMTTPLKLWHTVRQGLDAIIDGYPKTPGGKPILDPKGKAIQDFRGALSGKIKKMTGGDEGAFSQADKIFADASKIGRALEMGRGFVRGDSEITEQVFKALSDPEKKAYRAGVAQELKKRIRKDNVVPKTVMNVLKENTEIRDKLKVILPTQQQYDAFVKDLTREETFRETNNLRFGSQTHRLGAEEADVNMDAVGQAVTAGSQLLRGDIGGATAGAVRSALNFLKRAQVPQATRDQLGRLLLSKNQADKDEAFKLLRSIQSSGWVYTP